MASRPRRRGLPASLWRSPHDRALRSASALRHHRRQRRAGGGGALRDPSAGRPRRPGDQGGTPGRRRLRPSLRHHRARRVQLLRMAQPLQGVPDPGPEVGPGPGRPGATAGRCRRLRTEPGAGRGHPARAGRPGVAGAVPVFDPVHHLRIRDQRALGRPEGVRPARAVPDRTGLPDGERARVRPDRGVDRRHRGRDVRLLGRPHRPLHARHHGSRPRGGGLAVRGAGGVDGAARVLHAPRRHPAATARHPARHHRPVRRLPRGRRQGRPLLDPERARMGRAVRAVPGAPGSRRRPAFRHRLGSCVAPGGAERDRGRAVPRAGQSGSDEAAGRGGDRQLRCEHGRGVPHPPRARGAPPLAGRPTARGAGPVPALLPPVDLAGVTPRMDAVPAVGEHTDTILAALGHSAADIAALRADGVV